MLDGSDSVLEGDTGESIHGISFPRIFVIYNNGLKKENFFFVYSDINNDNYSLCWRIFLGRKVKLRQRKANDP
jgi:hypothetical protein